MDYVNDGQIVMVTYKGKKLRAEVAAAMGKTARCVNEMHGLDTWFDVRDLEPDPARFALRGH